MVKFLPKGWRRTRLSDIAEVNPKSQKIASTERIAFVAMTDVSTDGLLIKETDRLASDVMSGMTQFQEGDTLLAKITPCFENGKGAFISTLSHKYGFGSTEFHVIRPRTLVHPNYLFWLTRQTKFRKLGAQNMTGSAGQRRVPSEFLKSFPVPLPPRLEQEKIAKILGSVDAAIAATRRVIEQTRTLKCALMQELLTSKKRSSLGKQVKLGDVARITNGSTPSKKVSAYWENGNIPWLPTGKVNDKIITKADQFITQKALDECSLSLIPTGSTLVGMIGQGKTRGMTAYLTFDSTINQNFAAVIPGPELDDEFLFQLLTMQYRQLRESSQGSNQDALNCGILKSYQVVLPPMHVQQQVAALAKGFDIREREDIDFSELLQNVRTSLLAALLSGKVRVPSPEFSAVR